MCTNRISRLAAVAAPALLLLAHASSAQVITVTTTEDLTDFSGSQRVADLPGPDGLVSFREAIIAANNTPGPQTIEFAIPQASFWSLFPQMAMLKVETSGGFTLTDNSTTIDCTSQTRAIGHTNPAGNDIGIYSLMGTFTLPQAAITIAADNCVVKGLDAVQNFGYAVRILGNNNRVVGCHIVEPFGGLTYAAIAIRPATMDPPTGNTIGGTAPGEGNTLAAYPGSAIEVTGPAADTVIIGNTLTRSHIAGVLVQAGASGTRIGGPTAPERNLIAGNGTGGGGIPQYSDILLDGAIGTVVQGNYLGTSADGMTAAPPPASGIEARNCLSTSIIDNVISGYLAEGVHQGRNFRTGFAINISTLPGGITQGTVIQGNRIGVGADGVTPLPDAEGVHVSPFDAQWLTSLIGGDAPGQGNTIAHCAGSGVVIAGRASGVRISGNAIFASGAPDTLYPDRFPGIDLLGDSGAGVTPNDPGDADTGGNGLQNFPVLSSAAAVAGGIHITGSLDSYSSETFALEFFANPACDPGGFGQGAAFLGGVQVTADSLGHTDFAIDLAATIAPGAAVTATATRLSTGDTSEFSACAIVTPASLCPADFDNSGGLAVDDIFAFLNAWLAADARADFNHLDGLSVQDIFDFLNAWFAGCP